MAVNLETENDPERLRAVARLQDGELKRLAKLLKAKCDELDALKGTDSELQQALALLEAQRPTPATELPPPPPSEPKTRTGFGATEQPSLPREQRVIELPDDAKNCPKCGANTVALEGLDDISELVDNIDVRYLVVEVHRRKRRCTGCRTVIRAAGPQRAVPGGRYSLGFGVKIAIDKYQHHLPLARQARIMADKNLTVGRNTLWSLIDRMADELSPVWERLIDEILEHPVIGLDQTGWPNLDDRRKKKWQVWCLTAPGQVAHIIRNDKSAKTFKNIVGDYPGVIVCDALSSHISAAKSRGSPFVLAGCWAHVRRKFAEAEPDFPEARSALTWIRALYDIDARAATDDERIELRVAESTKVLDALKDWLIATRVPKTTALGAAIRYTLKDWARLTTFVTNSEVPLDNNATERGLRGIALGRRVHFGSKSRRGTQVAAIYYSLIESAKLAGVNPSEYLEQAMIAAREGLALTPAAYLEHLAQPPINAHRYESVAQPPSG